MIPGFNHNIKHKGRIYHIQTEDSGPKNPHIITHLFVGGNILASKKTEYTDILGKPDYEKTVRSMMEEQHKQMLRNLVNGVYDQVATGQAYQLDGPAPMNFTATSPATNAMAGGAAFKGLPSQAPTLRASDAVPLPGGAPAVPLPGAAPSGLPTAMAPTLTPAPLDLTIPVGGIPVSITPPSSKPEPALPEVQAAADERAAKAALPPGTIFGENLISEKSLDEVILSYLAEDLADSE